MLPIVRELKVLVDAGKPAVLKKTLQVLPKPGAGSEVNLNWDGPELRWYKVVHIMAGP